MGWFPGWSSKPPSQNMSKSAPKALFRYPAVATSSIRRHHEFIPAASVEGYRTFASHGCRPSSRATATLRRGQSPEVMVIGCCDSRVSPEVIFDAGPGELFVVRNVANLVPPYSLTASPTAFGGARVRVQVLRVRHIVVLGHAQCGGIRASAQIAPLSPGDFIGKWMSVHRAGRGGERARMRRNRIPSPDQKAAFLRSLDNLMTFPFCASGSIGATLTLHGAYFGVAEGSLLVLDKAAKGFQSGERRSAELLNLAPQVRGERIAATRIRGARFSEYRSRSPFAESHQPPDPAPLHEGEGREASHTFELRAAR